MPSDKWRIDFTNLNKVCLKDSFPFPCINLIVDSMPSHHMLSFMDVYSRYNQICMNLDGEENTSFITDRVLYCYSAMPLELKNAEATYQLLVNRMFKDYIRRNMEVYVGDLLVKSGTLKQHLGDF